MTNWQKEATKTTTSGCLTRRALICAASAYFGLDRGVAQASDGKPRRRIGVIYAYSDRFAAVLEATFDGILRASPSWTLDRKLIRPGISPAEFSNWNNSEVDGWMLLGTEAASLARSGRLVAPSIAGLQFVSPLNQGVFGGVSLDFHPEAVFPELNSLLPGHNRVHVIYVPGRDEWIIERLRRSGADYKYDVLPAPAASLRNATDHVSAALRYGNPATDIIWLLGGSNLVTRDTSAHLFQQAYNAKFPVFANRPAWVEEGAFLSGEPDFIEYGAQMSNLMERVLTSRERHFQLTAKIKFAMNVRVARRVGIEVTQEVRDRMGVLVADD